jgi:LuxR family maltose regulon positive regulatory protein
MPIYSGFVKKTLKQNLFKLMEAENWDGLSERLKHFLVRLSLIERLSSELVDILADNDKNLIKELKQQNAYIKFDSYGGAYSFQHLYLEFLHSKQNILTEEEKRETYKAAAAWCSQNNFKMEALNYYEKIGDYESIVLIFLKFIEHMPPELALSTAGIFERAPKEVFDKVDFFAAIHLYSLFCLGKWQEFYELAKTYEKKFTRLHEDNDFRNSALGGIYYVWGNMRLLMSTFETRYDFNKYDFDLYYKKMAECFSQANTETAQKLTIPIGAWASAAGSSEEGAPQGFAEAMTRTAEHLSPFFGGIMGTDYLCHGELKFYQNDIRAAETLFLQALEHARRHKQFEIIHRALFYIMRIAIIQGDRIKAEQTLKDLKALLDEEDYSRRFMTYDIALGWYYGVIRRYDMIPDWLKGEIAPYGHSYFIENFGNLIKARYCYLKRNYMPLMTYIRELRQRESVLYGRVEMLAMEACVRYQMKNKLAAWVSLREAYEEAAPNDIIMPFIELGKDMRTLTAAAVRELSENPGLDIGVPRSWLESVRHKATTYAKNQSMFITEYKLYNSSNALSAREQDILSDLYHGFSQSEIANKRSLSINTVKMVTKGIYDKLHVHKISDLIRIAAEQGLV